MRIATGMMTGDSLSGLTCCEASIEITCKGRDTFQLPAVSETASDGKVDRCQPS